MVVKVHRSSFDAHPLGRPNTSSICYKVVTNAGHGLFAVGRYNQYVDRRIVTITRELYPDSPDVQPSALLAVFRRWLRANTTYLAAATYTDDKHAGTHLRADGWVFVASNRGRRRWMRTL